MKYKNGILFIILFFIIAVIIFITWKTIKEGLEGDKISLQEDKISLQEGLDDPDNITIEMCIKIRNEFVSTLAGNIASVDLSQMNFPTKETVQNDLLAAVQDIPFPPILNKEYLLQYYESLTNAVSNGSETPGNISKATTSTQLPTTSTTVKTTTSTTVKTTSLPSFLKKQVPVYVSQVSKQMPYYLQYVVDKTISDYDTKMNDYINISQPSYSSML